MSTVRELVDEQLALWSRLQDLEREHREALDLLKKIATDNLPRAAPYWRHSRRNEARRIVARAGVREAVEKIQRVVRRG